MLQRPDALVVHALPGRVRFRIPSKKDDVVYFEELSDDFAKCTGLEKLVINPATASVLIQYDVKNTDTLNGFLQENTFFQVIDLDRQAPPSTNLKRKKKDRTRHIENINKDKSADFSRFIGLGLIALSGYRLLQDGFKAPAWHAALWYGYNLLRDNQICQKTGIQKPTVEQSEDEI